MAFRDNILQYFSYDPVAGGRDNRPEVQQFSKAGTMAASPAIGTDTYGHARIRCARP